MEKEELDFSILDSVETLSTDSSSTSFGCKDDPDPED